MDMADLHIYYHDNVYSYQPICGLYVHKPCRMPKNKDLIYNEAYRPGLNQDLGVAHLTTDVKTLLGSE